MYNVRISCEHRKKCVMVVCTVFGVLGRETPAVLDISWHWRLRVARVVVIASTVHPLAPELSELSELPLWLEVIAIFAHADFFNCFLHRYFGEKEAGLAPSKLVGSYRETNCERLLFSQNWESRWPLECFQVHLKKNEKSQYDHYEQ